MARKQDAAGSDEVELEVRVRPTDPRVAARSGRLAIAMVAATALHATRLLDAAQGRVDFEGAMLGYVVMLATTTVAVLGIGGLYDQMAGSLVTGPTDVATDVAADVQPGSGAGRLAAAGVVGSPAGGPASGVGNPAVGPAGGPVAQPVAEPVGGPARGERS